MGRNPHKNGLMVTLDNLSYLPSWLSDALCGLSTGGGLGMRQLYTDDDEVLFDAMRPIAMTAITEVATRGDLLDRAIQVELPPIPPDQRRAERDYWVDLEAARPAILGALLDAVAVGLRKLPATRLEEAPRLADFAHWMAATETGLGWLPGDFMRSYGGNRSTGHDVALGASPVAGVLRQVVECGGPSRHSATALLAVLRAAAGTELAEQRDWPKSARVLSSELRRLAPSLREVGVHVHFDLKTPGCNSVKRIAIHKKEECDASDASDAPGGVATRSAFLTTQRMGPATQDEAETRACVAGVAESPRSANGVQGARP